MRREGAPTRPIQEPEGALVAAVKVHTLHWLLRSVPQMFPRLSSTTVDQVKSDNKRDRNKKNNTCNKHDRNKKQKRGEEGDGGGQGMGRRFPLARSMSLQDSVLKLVSTHQTNYTLSMKCCGSIKKLRG